MHSKILLLNYTDNKDKQNLTNKKYLNFINSSCEILPLNRIKKEDNTFTTITTTELTNYPISNINTQFSLTKEAKTSIYTTTTEYTIPNKFTGISIELFKTASPTTEESTFNTIGIQFNKFDSTYTDLLQGLTGLKITFRNKAVESNSIHLIINQTTMSAQTTTGTLLFTTPYHLASFKENGLFILDSKIINSIFGTNYINSTDYYIDIFLNSVSSSTPNFSISNIFIGNSIDFYVDENLKYNLNNLNNFISHKRTGKSFLQKNNSLKSLKIGFDNLYSQEAIDNIMDVFKLNKDYPLFVFPYNNFNDTTYTTDDLKWLKLNYELGGLYYISKDLELTNSIYDVFSHSLELIEYK